MEIRTATLDDIEQICQLYNEFFAYNAKLQPEYCKEAKENGNYPKSTITDDKSDIIVAIENNIILDFIVTASCREKGVGAKLMDEAKKWTKTRALDYIELFALNNAIEANRFYEKNDFVTVSHTMRCVL